MHYIRQFFEVLFTPIRLLFTSPEKLIATPRRLLGLSLPARVTILVVIFEIAIVLLALLIQVLDRDLINSSPWWNSFWWAILPLAIVIPPVVYQALRLWLEGDVSDFPDIDRAWELGIAELNRLGIDLSATPLFLIVGSAGGRQERALFNASKLDLALADFPSGPSALHWYASRDGVYLVASDVGCLSKLASYGADSHVQPATGPAPARAAFNPRQTAVVGESIDLEQPEIAVATQTTEPPANVRGTMANIRGTMEISQADMDGPTASPTAGRVRQQGAIKLDRDQVDLQPKRLSYLCKLIRRVRQPLCPMNGILALLPYGLIQRGPVEGVEVQKAVRADLTLLVTDLRVRCPVTALVVGLEEEPGFHELIRRVGAQKARENRFGKGFGVWDATTPEQLEALCLHGCGAFEDWVYNLFREKDSLTTPGNTKLFGLLCKIRRLQSRLDGILVNGIAYDPDAKSPAERILFSGCYFAGTGDTEDQQAFVKSVFDKLPEQQEDLEWTAEALIEEARARSFARWVFAADGVMVIGVIALIWLIWHNSTPK